jgi:hypothetical protein
LTDKLNTEEKMKKDFATEKSQVVKEWQTKCETTALAARQVEKDLAKT